MTSDDFDTELDEVDADLPVPEWLYPDDDPEGRGWGEIVNNAVQAVNGRVSSVVSQLQNEIDQTRSELESEIDDEVDDLEGEIDDLDEAKYDKSGGEIDGDVDVEGDVELRSSEFEGAMRRRVGGHDNVVMGYADGEGQGPYYAGFDVGDGFFGIIDDEESLGDAPVQMDASSGDIDAEGDLDLGGDLTIGGSEIYLPGGSGSGGLRLGGGTSFSSYNDYTTAYAFTGEGAEGFRVRNPDADGPSDLFTIDANDRHTSVLGDLDVSGSVDFDGDVDVEGDVELDGEVEFEDEATFNGPIRMTGERAKVALESHIAYPPAISDSNLPRGQVNNAVYAAVERGIDVEVEPELDDGDISDMFYPDSYVGWYNENIPATVEIDWGHNQTYAAYAHAPTSATREASTVRLEGLIGGEWELLDETHGRPYIFGGFYEHDAERLRFVLEGADEGDAYTRIGNIAIYHQDNSSTGAYFQRGGGNIFGDVEFEADVVAEDGITANGSGGLNIGHYDHSGPRFGFRYPDDDEGDTPDGFRAEHGGRFEDVDNGSTVWWAEWNGDVFDFNYVPHFQGDRLATEAWVEDEADVGGGSGAGATNAVEAGVDNSGDSDVSDDLEEVINGSGAVILPEGTYRFEAGMSVADCEVICRGDVEFTIGDGAGVLFQAGTESDPVSYFELTGGPDVSLDGGHARVVEAVSDGYQRYEGITITDEWGEHRGPMRVDAVDGGAVVVERFEAPEGSIMADQLGTSGDSPTGMNVGPQDKGSVVKVVDCHLETWYDNGLYGYSGDGQLIVEGGRYINNGISGIRSQSDDTLFKAVRVELNADFPRDGAADLVRLRDGTNHRVRDCKLVADNTDAGEGDVDFMIDHHEDAGKAIIEGVDFYIRDSADAAIRSQSTDDPDGLTIMRDCYVDGDDSVTEPFGFCDFFRPALVDGVDMDLPSDTIGMRLLGDQSKITSSTVYAEDHCLRVSGEHTQIVSNPLLGGSSVRIDEGTGEVLVADNGLGVGVRDDGDNEITEERNFDLS